ncbi:hypothetical protein LCGC14_0487350 [marine sediment metagenome]|uniref:Serine protease n=1 Tax=marine sediment metagenome TaxID=412755 RepID=A0A0F9UUP9_9ZZZZ
MRLNVILFCLLFSFAMFVGAMMVPVNLDSDTLPNLVARTLPAVVEVRPGFARWMGVGVLVSSDGWILTAKHLVEKQDVMIVTALDGMKYMSTTIIEDPNNDLAYLKIDIEDAPHVKLSRSYPRHGEYIYAIGHPRKMFNSVSLGIVSNVRIDVPGFGFDLIVIDAEITGGNSGGPLFNMEGRLLGIVVAGSVYYSGIEANLVVPIMRSEELLDGYLGQQKIPTDCNSVGVPSL